MEKDRARQRIEQLLRLATDAGASPDEARNAAWAAAKLMHKHQLQPSTLATSVPALDQALEIVGLKLQIMDLQNVLADRQRQYASELSTKDAYLRWELTYVRAAERRAAKRQVKAAKRVTTFLERETFARAGGDARAKKLDPQRRVEIARSAAEARWARRRDPQQG